MLIINQSTLDYIHKHKNDDIHKLALKSHDYSINLQFALQQIEGYQRIKDKVSLWANSEINIIFPPHLSIEQCSSEKTAAYKFDIIVKGENMLDLTGGLGVDFSCISKKFTTSTYLEKDPLLCKIAENNFKELKLSNYSIINDSAENFLAQTSQHFNLIYADPARRGDNGEKTFLPCDCKPDLTELEPILKKTTDYLIVKYAPLLDLNVAIKTFDNICDIHIISVNNECKELVCLINYTQKEKSVPLIHCINLSTNKTETFSFFYKQKSAHEQIYCSTLKDFLYEPNSSLQKAGPFDLIAEKYDVNQLNPNSHLFTSDKIIKDFPGRKFKIEFASNFSKEQLKESLKNIKQANISTRNFPISNDQLKKKLKLKDGGDLYIFGTTLSNNKHVIIGCSKINKSLL